MNETNLIQAFLGRASSHGSKSTIIKPIAWLMGILLSALLITAKLDSPTWLLILLAVLICILFVLYLCAYIYFSIKNPDYLRSERYSLSKLAIEKNIIGDSTTGYFQELEQAGQKTILIQQPEADKDNQGAQ